MKQTNWGHFDIILDEYIAIHNISKNKLAAAAELQRTQLNAYCKNKVQRPDLGVLARICCVLDCELNDIIKYHSPVGEHPSVKKAQCKEENYESAD